MSSLRLGPDLTPWERYAGHLVKRDDLFDVAGSRGGKVRTCLALAQQAVEQGSGLVTAGSRKSPQVNIVASIAAELGLPCQVHVPAGPETPELVAAAARGAEVVRHRPGHNSVIVSRARRAAADLGWVEIPFGMECEEAVRQTQQQVANLPRSVRRLIVPVGSGMSLAGILHGLSLLEDGDQVAVVGVMVGASPLRRLDRYAPPFWREQARLVQAREDYHAEARWQMIGDLRLDPIYEAKCLPFLESGDALWVVGRRESVA